MRGTRAERLERLQALKRRQREIEETRLAALLAKAAGLETQATEILHSLGVHSPLSGLFLEAKAQRLRRVEAERQAVLAEAETVRRKLGEAGATEKRVERIAVEARGLQRAADEAKSLADILDARFGAGAASFE